MRQYLSAGDFTDLYIRLLQRGNLSFLRPIWKNAKERTRLTFDHQFAISIWNMIPAVKQRLNAKVSGAPKVNYEQHFINKHLKDRHNLRLLSIGCGTASHEQYLAAHGPFSLIHGIDLAPTLIRVAQEQAHEKGLQNCRFEVLNFISDQIDGPYDVVLFHQSLHHFKDFDFILGEFVPRVLTTDGLLLLNEYGGPDRFQWPPHQLKNAQAALRRLPVAYRQIFKTQLIKSKIYRPGWWRMKFADPSESLNSGELRPKLYQYFNTLRGKTPWRQPSIHLVLKDIAHNFCDNRPESLACLQELFAAEDSYLQENPTDFFYGVYQPCH
ncbi:MAG: class I SAM-dependent methyltransferase [Owenweeksia sp.]|nr:class I SAM-dependent methyltransferase [Owenweeksia sp.]